MGSSNPITTFIDSSAKVIQRFRVGKPQRLAMDLVYISGNVVNQNATDLEPGIGKVSWPSSLASLSRYGTSVVYGVLNVDVGTPEVPSLKPALAQLSPTVRPITVSGSKVLLGDNKSVAAAGTGDNYGWVYVIDSSTDNPKLVEYAIDYTNNNNPTRTTSTAGSVHKKSRIGAVAIPPAGVQWSRWTIYQDANKGLRNRIWPGNQDDVVTEDNVLEGTPIAVTLKTVSNVHTVYVYFVDASHRFCRAEKSGTGTGWTRTTILPNDKIDASSDIGVSYAGGTVGNVYNVIFDQNTDYDMKTDVV